MSDRPLQGHAALITAGGTGIGFASAQRLVRDGASVTIAARREEVLVQAAEQLRADAAAGVAVQHVVCDVSDEDQVVAAVAAATGPTGALQYVVASAGTGSLGPIHKTSRAEWDHVVATNLTGTFHTLRHATHPIVEAGGGAMVAVSSTAGAQVHPLLGSYAVTKAGIDMMVRHLADELGPWGVRVNSVRPGIVETELMEIPMQADALVEDYVSQMPLGRVGKPADVAEAVRYLLGPESSWVTGVCFDIDGGMHLRRAADYGHLARGFFGDEGLADLLRP